MNTFSWYSKLPVFLQNLLISLKGWYIQNTRFNHTFKDELSRFEKSNPEQVDMVALRLFLTHAQRSNFWHDRFVRYHVDVKAADLCAEIRKLPILTKNEVKAHVQDILIRDHAYKLRKITTSGTTGSGLVFYQTDVMENKQWAVWWRYRIRLGIKLGIWMGWFGGRSIMAVDQHKSPYWRINVPGKQVMFSAHHLNPNTIRFYYDEIVKKKLKWLHGYPSQLAYLASLIRECHLPFLKMDFVTLGAENLLEHQIDIIKEVFGVFPMQHYGLAEGVANVSQLPNGEFQPDLDFAYMELIKDGDRFRVVGTNYSNLAFPLIRYDTNDFAFVRESENMSILGFDGRKEDYVILPNGTKLGRLDHIFKNAVYVKEAQIYQKDYNHIELRIVPNHDFCREIHEKEILDEARKRLGKDVALTIRYLDKIERTHSGKLKFVISDVATS